MFLTAYLTGGDGINYIPVATGESDLRWYDYHRVAPAPLDWMDPASVVALRPAVLEHKRWLSWHVLKTHHCNKRINGINLIPAHITERAVYLIRDPRDVLPSLATHISVSNDRAAEIMTDAKGLIAAPEAPQLCHFLMDWTTHVKSWQEAEFPVLAIRYEDLLANPEREFSRILEFLGFEVRQARLRRALEETRLDTLKIKEKRFGFYDSVGGSFFNREHEEVTREQLNKIVDAHGEMMESLGYETNGYE